MKFIILSTVLVIVIKFSPVALFAGQIEIPSAEEISARADKIKPELEQLLSKFEAKTFVTQKDVTIPYRLFKPKKQEQNKKYPIVIYLHGSGGCGSDNLKQISGGNTWGSRIWVLPANQE